jgi:hypothetical protein
MTSIKRIDPGPRMSEAVIHGGKISSWLIQWQEGGYSNKRWIF